MSVRLPIRLIVAASLSFALAIAGCGASSSGSVALDGGGVDATSDGAADAAQDGAQADAIPPADGPFACDTSTCIATDFCVHPCCGGANPTCELLPDGGVCPPGTHSDSTCMQGGGVSGCRPDPCTPPPAFCSPTPSCGPNAGGSNSQGHDVHCMCA